MINAEAILEKLKQAIQEDTLQFPTLSEVAQQVRETAASEEASVASLAKIIQQDPAITARLMGIANSTAYRGTSEVQEAKAAISRLGMKATASLVTSIAMEQMFKAKSPLIQARLQAVWQHATEVAGIAYVLSKHFSSLPPEQASLAALVHEIGTLPLLVFAEEQQGLLENPRFLTTMLNKTAPKLGTIILQQWHFPSAIQLAPNWAQLLTHGGDGPPQIIDVVIVAKLQALEHSDHQLAQFPWTEVPAFARLGIEIEQAHAQIEDLSEEMASATAMLAG